MSKERFDQKQWRQEKYRGRELSFLSKAEYEKELEQIKLIACEAVEKLDRKSRKEYGLDYEIVGLLIFGSWAEGTVHQLSDIDVFTLATRDPCDLVYEFITELKNRGVKRFIDHVDHILLNDPEETRQILTEGVIGESYILATPYQWVVDKFEQIVENKKGATEN